MASLLFGSETGRPQLVAVGAKRAGGLERESLVMAMDAPRRGVDKRTHRGTAPLTLPPAELLTRLTASLTEQRIRVAIGFPFLAKRAERWKTKIEDRRPGSLHPLCFGGEDWHGFR